MKVAVVGLGFVGNALANGFKDNVQLIKIDPKLNTDITDLIKFDPEIIFISVPTPMHNDGSQDITIVNKIIEEINQSKKEFLIVLKSTILPSSLDEIRNKHKKLVFNPEFLRESHAEEDFINSKTIVLGGESKETNKVSEFYINYTKCKTKDHIFTDHITASLIKYTINSFLATKVVFFNELYKIFLKSNANDTWENFIDAVSTDTRIGSSHMNVPGPDERFGFGGPCFPKDTRALHEYSKNIGSEFNLLQVAIKTNNTIRSVYNTVTEREKDQNINFENNGE